jgi:hypothetical protein
MQHREFLGNGAKRISHIIQQNYKVRFAGYLIGIVILNAAKDLIAGQRFTSRLGDSSLRSE